MNSAAALAIPFFGPEKINLVFLDRAAHGVAKIVAAQQLLLAAGVAWHGAAALEEVILGVQSVVPPEIIDVAVVLVASALGYHVNLGASCAAKFGPIAVALNLEFFDAVNGRVDKNGALRADIVVPRAVHGPLVVDRGRTAEGNIHAGEQALVLVVEALASGCAGNQQSQLYEVPAVHGQFANLFADHDIRNVASRRIDRDGGGFHHHRFGGRAHLHFHVEGGHIGNVQFHIPLREFLESALIHGEAIGASLELGEGEAALLV